MRERQKYSSGTKWEPIVGYSRAVRVGDRIYVTGTTATGDHGEIVGIGDAYAQAVQCIKMFMGALNALNAGLENVVRTRMFVTDISRWEESGTGAWRVFSRNNARDNNGRSFATDRPDMLIEIEADAEL